MVAACAWRNVVHRLSFSWRVCSHRSADIVLVAIRGAEARNARM